MASITHNQIDLINNNIARLDTIINITKAQVENGYAKAVDLDRAVVGKSNLEIQLDNTISLYKQQLDMIKYYIDMPKDIAITDTIGSLLPSRLTEFKQSEILNRREVKLLELQKDLYGDNLSAVKLRISPYFVVLLTIPIPEYARRLQIIRL